MNKTAILGRVLLASLFLMAGVNKLINEAPYLTRLTEVGFELAHAVLWTTAAFEIIGALMIIVSNRWTPIAAIALAIFAISTNVFFHQFWTFTGEMRQLELSLFFKNIAICGALLYLASNEARKSDVKMG